MSYVDANGLKIFYREIGEGEPVLLLQGFEMDHRGWAMQVSELRQHFQCISMDNRDVGQSNHATASYSVADMAADALGLLDALGIQRAHVVGHSLGGAIAQEMAISHPERMHKVALVASYVHMGLRDQAITEARKTARSKLTLREYYEVIFPWIYSEGDYSVPGQMETILERAAANADPQSYDAYSRQSAAVIGHDTRGRLSGIAAPTLVLCGDADQVTPLEQSEQLKDEIPNARLHVLKGGGHGVLWTQHAGEVNQALVRFLKE